MSKVAKKPTSNNQTNCCRQTRQGIPAPTVNSTNRATNPNRATPLAKTGISRKASSQPSFTRESRRWSQVTGCSRYSPKGSDRIKSMNGSA